MDPILVSSICAAIACAVGIALGWRWRTRQYLRYLDDLEQESGARSLELLETRQHLRKISGHLEHSLKKDRTIRRLRRKHKSLQREIDQQVLKARRQEKAHFIQTAKIKLELIEARMQQPQTEQANRDSNQAEQSQAQLNKSGPVRNGALVDNKLTYSALHDVSAKDFGELNSELQSLLEQAGIKRVRQLASLSKQDIEQLTSQSNRQTAE